MTDPTTCGDKGFASCCCQRIRKPVGERHLADLPPLPNDDWAAGPIGSASPLETVVRVVATRAGVVSQTVTEK